MPLTEPHPRTSFWSRIAAWLEALESPTAAEETERLLGRVAALEEDVAALRTQRPAATSR